MFGILQRIVNMVLIVSAMALMVGCGNNHEEKPEPIRPVKHMIVGSLDGAGARQYPGKVEAASGVDLAFEVPGKIVKLNVKAGQNVTEGDVVARLDSRDFQSVLNSAAARARQAKSDLDRYSTLLKDNVVAMGAYDQKKRDYDVAAADVSIAAKALDDTVIKAPFSGVIGSRYVENFQNVQAKQPVVSLQRTGDVEISVNVPEQAIISGQNGTHQAEVEFAAIPDRRFKVELKELAHEADPQTQTYKVVLTMPAPEGVNILPGMTATVHHRFESEEQVGFLVPVQAIFGDAQDRSFVWVINPETMTVARSEVAIGDMTGDSIFVLSGLNKDDVIATAGVHYLQEGQVVRLLEGEIGG